MKIHFGNPDRPATIAKIVPLYGDREFESPTRSTIPMLSLLAHSRGKFKRIVRQLGFPAVFDVYLEYTVSPRDGRGKASHTDVMLKSGNSALAIEAKWTESMYEKVKEWRVAGKDESNRLKVLGSWLGVLSRRTGMQYKAAEFDDVVYQMIHRAASAVETGENSSLAYFQFTASSSGTAKADDIRRELSILWQKLGKPDSLPMHVVRIETTILPEYQPIAELKKSESTAERVCAALQGKKQLFSFTPSTSQRVGA